MSQAFSISDHEFNAIRDLMYDATGVLLRDSKKPLVISRLRRRLTELNCDNFLSYIKILKQSGSREIDIFINAITTNETQFYRHKKQFQILTESILPLIQRRHRDRGSRELRFWSAACSTGEEPYSIAIALREYLIKDPSWRISIIATDINSDVLESAKEGVFSKRSLNELPQELREKYFSKFEGASKKYGEYFRLCDDIKSRVQFVPHNLMRPFAQKDFDVVFFRNCMIYFDQMSKQRVINHIAQNVVADGFLVISLAENLHGLGGPFCYIGSGIYQKGEQQESTWSEGYKGKRT